MPEGSFAVQLPDLIGAIKRRAYEIWNTEGCPHGRDQIHWLRAEAEIREEFPAFRLVAKHSDLLSKLIHYALVTVTFGGQRSYLSHYHTVLGDTLYTPATWESTADLDRAIVLRHERVHLRQRRRYGFALMAFAVASAAETYRVTLFQPSVVAGKELKPGDIVAALVLEEENDEGLVVMSLRMASQRKAWDKFHKLVENDSTMKFVAQEANKGGLIANIDGIRAFLPVSQLAPVNYPRVNNADSSEIISRLSKFVGHNFTVKIVTMDEEAGKIVVSEREAMAEERAKALEGLTIGRLADDLGMSKSGLFAHSG